MTALRYQYGSGKMPARQGVRWWKGRVNCSQEAAPELGSPFAGDCYPQLACVQRLPWGCRAHRRKSVTGLSGLGLRNLIARRDPAGKLKSPRKRHPAHTVYI